MSTWADGVWAALGATLAEPLHKAFRDHLDEHRCGTGDYRSPHYVGGFAHCPAAMELWELLPDGDRIVLG
ncbi:hypothetical protein GCM10010399_92990 [Dactylosporangium fulvum]|uniref:Uncharacterized protein n=1 Tax=Dactylosporangium fulvum TaxID=53359 RepID=A0ABY5WAV4_9ACTN|nr:hypothetical protein [Dactylosporangium fulvum]UWP85828.1 hypothetical protein Dfulv_16910 [Dactylosporangium fulvum]